MDTFEIDELQRPWVHVDRIISILLIHKIKG